MLRLLLLLFLVCPLLCFGAAPSLERVVVIGASVSRGFTESQPFGGEKADELRFDRYLDAALTVPHGKIINDSNHLFFMSPQKEATLQLKRLSKRAPTLVIGVDFLFWFLYGHLSETGERLELFDQGLSMLEQIKVPLIVGDIPDASAAIGHMLSKPMVPDAATIAEANRRLKAWATDRPGVSIVSLSTFMKASQANSGIKFGQCQWSTGETSKLLQPDRLHPSVSGCAALAIATLTSLSNQDFPSSSILWSPAAIEEKASEDTP